MAVLRQKFQPAGCYLDWATHGLPLPSALEEFSAVTSAWARGGYDPVSCDRAVARARGAFARLHGIATADVAIGHQVSPLVGLIAASLARGAHVVAAEGDFTSLLFPFLAAGCVVRTVALERLAFEDLGIETIYEHNLTLAGRLRTELGVGLANSAIVSLSVPGDTAERLERAGVKTSVRAGRVRLSCHLYNDGEDIDRALEVLAAR